MNRNELITVVVNFGEGSKVLRTAREYGVLGGTLYIGRGVGENKLLQFLALDEIRKEILIMVAPASISRKVGKALAEKFEFSKKKKGIFFSREIIRFVGGYQDGAKFIEEEAKVESMYHVLTVIVDRGKGQKVVSAGVKAGARGATIINARGSGIHETAKVFSMEIEPEKEVVLIIIKKDITEAVVESINKSLDISQPGAGILYVQEAIETYGLL